jgi:hypothetical protein
LIIDQQILQLPAILRAISTSRLAGEHGTVPHHD